MPQWGPTAFKGTGIYKNLLSFEFHLLLASPGPHRVQLHKWTMVNKFSPHPPIRADAKQILIWKAYRIVNWDRANSLHYTAIISSLGFLIWGALRELACSFQWHISTDFQLDSKSVPECIQMKAHPIATRTDLCVATNVSTSTSERWGTCRQR